MNGGLGHWVLGVKHTTWKWYVTAICFQEYLILGQPEAGGRALQLCWSGHHTNLFHLRLLGGLPVKCWSSQPKEEAFLPTAFTQNVPIRGNLHFHVIVKGQEGDNLQWNTMGIMESFCPLFPMPFLIWSGIFYGCYLYLKNGAGRRMTDVSSLVLGSVLKTKTNP